MVVWIMIFIDIDPVPSFKFSPEPAFFEGYKLRFWIRWQTSCLEWHIDIDCDELDLHRHGFTMVTGEDMIDNRTQKILGALLLVDTQGDEDPEYEGLGDRWKLAYITRAEIDASS